MIHGRVYKIYCNETGECYYGSSEQTLSRRLSQHKKSCKKWKEGIQKSCETSFRIIERGNFTISLLEENDFENKDYMKAREGYYIENFECVNKRVEGRTKKEYREATKEHKKEYDKKNYKDNKEQKIKKSKEYREANKEQLAEQMKQKITCECGCIISRRNIAPHRKSKKHLSLI